MERIDELDQTCATRGPLGFIHDPEMVFQMNCIQFFVPLISPSFTNKEMQRLLKT